eukprot:6178325-Pleurochrysis_carterae.AAC.3
MRVATAAGVPVKAAMERGDTWPATGRPRSISSVIEHSAHAVAKARMPFAAPSAAAYTIGGMWTGPAGGYGCAPLFSSEEIIWTLSATATA